MRAGAAAAQLPGHHGLGRIASKRRRQRARLDHLHHRVEQCGLPVRRDGNRGQRGLYSEQVRLTANIIKMF